MNGNAFAQSWAPRMLSILRIVAALLFLEHGAQKIFDFPHSDTHMPYVLTSLVPGVAGLIEFIGGLLLLAGLFTRPTAFIGSGEMAAAYFIGHFPKSVFPILNGGGEAVMLCFVFLYLACAGPGPWSLDAIRRKG
ncbi:MAG TPA: DoxX family protein [Caulobacteraceae bacterium]|jgi:putative oxidoreductase|nr:DoxX family protein [Caulobacteraceae bacterium]